MSGLAKLLLTFSLKVSGSDLSRNAFTDELVQMGASVFTGVDGERKELIEADVVVYTDAISLDNAELLTAKRLKKRLYSRGEFLSLVSRRFSTVITVAGSHGKTTCTAMCAHILATAAAPFTAHIGGEDLQFKNFCFHGREYFLTEACEYKKNLLKIQSDIAILLNADKDHLDSYNGEEDLRNCFIKYLNGAKQKIVYADEQGINVDGAITFGFSQNANYQAKDLTSLGEKYSFDVYEYGKYLCRVRLDVVGKCNVYNALAAIAVSRLLHISTRAIRVGLSTFKGVKRRFERLGEVFGGEIIADYAHHPKEILSTLKTAERIGQGRLFAVFQPHTYSRTKHLFQEFVECLSGVENLMIFKTYAARETKKDGVSALELKEKLPNALYAESLREVEIWLKKSVRRGDVVLFLGAGDIYHIAKFLATQASF